MSRDDVAAPTTVSTLRLDGESIKVLAHPLRSRLLTALRVDGPATATTLAERLGTNTGATSYHLRKLEAVGLVEETGAGRGRERWWRPTTQMHAFDDDIAEGDPDARAAVGWLREHYLHEFVRRAQAWLAHHDAWPLEWRRLAGSSDYALQLTPAELEALMHELWAVVERVHAETTAAAGAEDGAGEVRQRVLIYLHDFPDGEAPR